MNLDEDTRGLSSFETLRSCEFVLLPSDFAGLAEADTRLSARLEDLRAFACELDADTEEWRPQVRPAAQPRGNGPRMAVAFGPRARAC